MNKTARAVLNALAVLIVLIWVFPVYWMLNSSLLPKVTPERSDRPLRLSLIPI